MVVLAFGFRVSGMLILRTYHFSTVKAPFSTTPPEFSFGCETGSIAASLARGEGFSSPFGNPTGATAWIAPIYPVLVAGIFKIFGVYSTGSAIAVLSLNCLFSALTCIPIVSLGRRTVGYAAGLLAGWLWAIVPLFMVWPISWVWDMSLSALLLTVLLLSTLRVAQLTSRIGWVGYGILWAVAALTNPALLSMLPFTAVWLLLKKHRRHQDYWRAFVFTAITFLVCILPWMVRNDLALGKPVFIRDNFWVEFHLGNYHLSNGMGWGGKHPTLNIRELNLFRALGEVRYIEHYRAESLKFVRDYPAEFTALTGKRFVTFWSADFYHYRWWETPLFVSLSLLGFLGVIVALANQIEGADLFANVLLCYPMVYYLTYSFPRYRHAIEPELLILASYFLCETARDFHLRLAERRANASVVEESIEV